MSEVGTIKVISFHNAGVPIDCPCNKVKDVKDIAACYGFATDDVTIHVNDKEADLNTPVRAGDWVSFQKGSTKSGR